MEQTHVNQLQGTYYIYNTSSQLMPHGQVNDLTPVSYTHLDVYKRQSWQRVANVKILTSYLFINSNQKSRVATNIFKGQIWKPLPVSYTHLQWTPYHPYYILEHFLKIMENNYLWFASNKHCYRQILENGEIMFH